MDFFSNKVLTLPVIANINSVVINNPAVNTEIDLSADCNGGPFSDVNIGVIILAGMQFYTYDQYLEGVADQSINPMAGKVIGLVISCPGYWIMLDMNVAQFMEELGFCCHGNFITSAPYALKNSRSALTPGKKYKCGTKTGFKWLAILGDEDPPPNYTFFFEIELQTEDASITLVDVLSTGPLVSTVQTIMNWPADFIGVTIDGITLIGNDEVAGVNELKVSEFNYGTITVRVRLVNWPDQLIDEKEWSLPNSCADSDSPSSVPDSGEFAPAEFTEEFNI